MARNIDTKRVEKCLTGIKYPSDKNQLIAHAQNTCGDEGVISMLKDLPEQSYGKASTLDQALSGLLGGGIHLRLDI